MHTDPLIRDPVLFIGYGFFFALNPASPISRFSGKVVPSEEVPEGWRGSWVGQFATESLWRCGYWGYNVFFALFSLEKGERENMKIVIPIISKQQTPKNE